MDMTRHEWCTRLQYCAVLQYCERLPDEPIRRKQRVTRSRGAAARIARDHRVAYRRHRGAKPVKPLLVEDIVS